MLPVKYRIDELVVTQKKVTGMRRTTTERDPLVRRRDPLRQRRIADGVVEADHARDGRPAVLAQPPVRAALARARSRAAVRRAIIGAAEAVAREDRRRPVRVCEGEDHGGDVGVGGGVVVERVSVLMRA